MNQLHKFIWIIFCLILLSACQTRNKVKPNPQDQVDLSAVESYQFLGKMSFSDGQDGGSGKVSWKFNQGRIDATLKAPLGSQSWQVIESISGSTLISNSGEVVTATNTEELISMQLGWAVPWQSLTAWVLGQPHDNRQAELMWGQGTFSIKEAGWHIVYSKLRGYPEGLMPHKMVARKGDYAIKLAVKSWQW